MSAIVRGCHQHQIEKYNLPSETETYELEVYSPRSQTMSENMAELESPDSVIEGGYLDALRKMELSDDDLEYCFNKVESTLSDYKTMVEIISATCEKGDRGDDSDEELNWWEKPNQPGQQLEVQIQIEKFRHEQRKIKYLVGLILGGSLNVALKNELKKRDWSDCEFNELEKESESRTKFRKKLAEQAMAKKDLFILELIPKDALSEISQTVIEKLNVYGKMQAHLSERMQATIKREDEPM